MADVLIIGAGLNGLSTAMLLARDGHQVTVLERDPAERVDAPDEAWESWERKGVNQFRMIHFVLARWRQIVEAELPSVAAELERRGGLRYNFIAEAPEFISGGRREGDERFGTLTGRRPVIESAVAAVAEATPGVTVRRGIAVAGLVCGEAAAPGVPHVVGVRTEAGEELRADLLIDATGRRSSLPRLLADVGARAPIEEIEDSGFVYYGRHFRSADGSVPAMMGPLLQHYGTISVLCLPADNGTWGMGIIASAKDAAMRGVKDPARWEAVISRHPLIAHWLDGEPIDDGVAVMAKLEDRWRRFVVDGSPVATGVVAVGDSWACTNPSLGRGITIGLLHALALRETMRSADLADPVAFAMAFDEATVRDVEPWYRSTLWYDRHRLAEIESLMAGESYEPEDETWGILKAFEAAVTADGELLRAFGDMMMLLTTPDEVFSRPGIVEKVIELGAGWRDAPMMAPSRDELLATASG